MATVNQILNDAKTRYRHAYPTSTVVGWLDSIHKRMWKMVPRDIEPAVIILNGSNQYALPKEIKRKNIKKVTMGPVSGPFRSLEYADLDDPFGQTTYSLLSDKIIVDESTNTDTQNSYLLMVYYDKTVPTTLTEDDLDASPELDETYHEALTVGLLEMIAGARKDVKMKNNYASDYRELLGDFLMEATTEEPDYPSCRDELPRRSRYGSSVED